MSAQTTNAAPGPAQTTAPRPPLGDRYRTEEGEVQLTGVQALVRLPFDVLRAERRADRDTAVFISGYEGSPLAGYDLELQRNKALVDEHGLVFRPGVNEELAATAVQGTQLASISDDSTVEGVVGFWYGKTPGLDRASDALRHANLMGAAPTGGAVAFVGDDPASKSSTLPGACEGLLIDLGMPVLFPADPQDALDLGMHAVAMSRASGLWVGMKIATNVADGFQTVSISPPETLPAAPPDADAHHTVSARLVQPVIGDLERSRDGKRLDAARQYGRHHGLNRIHNRVPGQTIGIVASGKTYLDVQQAMRVVGIDDTESADSIRLLQLRMIWPLDPIQIREFAEGLDRIVVVEEKRPLIEPMLKDILYGVPGAPAVIGKGRGEKGRLFPMDGELDADRVAHGLATHLAGIGDFPAAEAWLAKKRSTGVRNLLPMVTRTPYFCSGCPHNLSTRVPEGALVGAGIGCHAMTALMDSDRVGEITGLTQMGGEGAQWIGMAPFVSQNHLIQNLGDGTFHHSGSLAIRGAVAAGSDITYKLLYNSAVAMTGGQQAVGVMSVLDIARNLLAEGVSEILITTDDPSRYRWIRLPKHVKVWHRDRLVEAQERLASVGGVTVLIHDQECATELRRKRKRGLLPTPAETVVINERVCEGCGDCGSKSNCLSVQPVPTEFGRKTEIDQSTCNKDFSCLDGDCPAFMTVTTKKPSRWSKIRTPFRTAVLEPLGADAFDDPATSILEPRTIRMTGIGGTGVVTLAQTLGQAASMAGLHVRALDQTGLAQKGGAVVSDLRVSPSPDSATNKLAAGECDLYLACDLLVGASEAYLAVADPRRTTAIVATAKVPTGQMVVDTAAAFPDDAATIGRIREVTRPDGVFIDARAMSEALLGDEQYSNILLAGVAFQSGVLPLPARDIEEAIRFNGIRVDENLQAFRRGRQLVADPGTAAAAMAESATADTEAPTTSAVITELCGVVHAEPGSELERLVAIRVRDLVAFQDVAYARRYAEKVEQIRRAESAVAPKSAELSEAVAWSLHKLMAYKDEYEVARLLLGPSGAETARREIGSDVRVAYRLHPPVLRAMGWGHKISLGPWSRPALHALVAARRLRGTRFDPFGGAEVRRIERELVLEFIDVLDQVAVSLNAQNISAAIELAKLPDMVRGYEQIKLDNIDAYRVKLRELRSQLRSDVAVMA